MLLIHLHADGLLCPLQDAQQWDGRLHLAMNGKSFAVLQEHFADLLPKVSPVPTHVPSVGCCLLGLTHPLLADPCPSHCVCPHVA